MVAVASKSLVYSNFKAPKERSGPYDESFKVFSKCSVKQIKFSKEIYFTLMIYKDLFSLHTSKISINRNPVKKCVRSWNKLNFCLILLKVDVLLRDHQS